MKSINITLDVKSIDKAIKELNNVSNSLNILAERFVRRLSDVGIAIGETYTEVQIDDKGSLGYLVEFKLQDLETTNDGCIGYLVAKDKGQFESRWIVYDKTTHKEVVKSASISPTLMYEFGSGLYAVKGHRGTFPGQTHANDSEGWWYKDYDTQEWVHSNGIVPTQPMQHAYDGMKKQIKKIAKEVYGGK